MADAVGEMFICSTLGPNLSEMEFRTFVSMWKVIWNQLLASRALIIQRKAFSNLYMPSTAWLEI